MGFNVSIKKDRRRKEGNKRRKQKEKKVKTKQYSRQWSAKSILGGGRGSVTGAATVQVANEADNTVLSTE